MNHGRRNGLALAIPKRFTKHTGHIRSHHPDFSRQNGNPHGRFILSRHSKTCSHHRDCSLIPVRTEHSAPPTLSSTIFPCFARAGITDWAAFSPVTQSILNPKAAWPHIARPQTETEARGSFAARLAILSEFLRP